MKVVNDWLKNEGRKVMTKDATLGVIGWTYTADAIIGKVRQFLADQDDH